MTTHDDQRFEAFMAEVADELRREADRVTEAEVAESTARVAARLFGVRPATGRVLTCDDIVAALPAYDAGSLDADHTALIRDHLGHCLACRRAWRGRSVAPSGSRESARSSGRAAALRRWSALAAGLALAVVGAWWMVGALGTDGAASTVIAGTVYRLDGGSIEPLPLGAVVEPGIEVRTPRDTGAVLELEDGSRVELRERSQMWVEGDRGGTTVHLGRGNVIVEAAPQPRPRHLRVVTTDVKVAVTGTIFAVGSGMKGSRVAVIEGEVRVAEGGQEHVLGPGDLVASEEGLGRGTVASDFAWSRDASRYEALIAELEALGEELMAIPHPAPRDRSAFLEQAPGSTVLFGAFPNFSQTVEEGLGVLENRLAQSPVLAEWWAEKTEGLDFGAEMATLAPWLTDLGGSLGEEVALLLWLDDADELEGPVVLASVADRATLVDFLEQQIDAGGEVTFLQDEMPPADALDDDHVWIVLAGDTLYAAPSGAAIRTLALEGGGGPAGPLGLALTDAYAQGVESVVAVDLGRWLGTEIDAEHGALLDGLGFADAEVLLIEGERQGRRSTWQASLTFAGERHGLASWLAPPAPMGALDFVSPDAAAFGALVLKDPALMLDDLEAWADLSDDGHGIAEVESELGIDLRADLAEPMGGELAIAIDGPVLPVPAWKLVVEIYDPTRFQIGLERLVDALSARIMAEGGAPVSIGEETRGGAIYYRVAHGEDDHGCYTYHSGYLVAAAECARVEAAIDSFESGYSIGHSDALAELLPTGGPLGFSALGFQRLTGDLGEALQNLTGGEAPVALGGDTLSYVYAWDDRIEAAASTDAGAWLQTLWQVIGREWSLDGES